MTTSSTPSNGVDTVDMSTPTIETNPRSDQYISVEITLNFLP